MSLKSFPQDDNAVTIEIGYILNLVVLTIVTGTIAGTFYLRSEDVSHQAMRMGFTDLGSEIARDVTNMYLISESSQNISLNVVRNIPLAMGGKSYRIKLTNTTPIATIDIGGDVYGYNVTTTLNSIDSGVVVCSNTVYSGSGEITINMTRNNGNWNLCMN